MPTDHAVPALRASRRQRLSELSAGGYQAIPASIVLILIIVWSAHDGGFDEDTWYWGALVALAILAATLAGAFGAVSRPIRATRLALAGFAFYVLWSYASIAWASYKGDALNGSNRALLYLTIFALLTVVPWTARRALWMLVAYALGVGAIAVVLLSDMALGQHVGSLFSEGRLVIPTGYFNSDAAMFMMLALVALGLSVRRELPAILRGLMLSLSCAGLQLALLGESRGWLFTLPLVLVAALVASRDRLAVSIAAIGPVAGFAVVLSPLLDVYKVSEVDHPSAAVIHQAAQHAGRLSLLACAVVLIAGALAAFAGPRMLPRRPSRSARKVIGTAAAAAMVVVALLGANFATHSHPIRFINDQWYGFTHPAVTTTVGSGSHFAAVGSERYDYWRVALDAFVAHPIGGLGQDNFADYYVVHRHTGVEVEWTHSWELRLLAHTGIVGLVSFAIFLGAALTAAVRARRGSDPLQQAVAGIALMPLIVWLIHGSIDWFWELPALSGPALGFLAMAAALSAPTAPDPRAPAKRSVRRSILTSTALAGVLIAAVVVLAFPYLSVRETSIGNDLRSTDPAGALAAFSRAASLDPFNSDPGRYGGAAALEQGQYQNAEQRFTQAIEREPGGWFPWLGAGLAASALGDRTGARRDFRVADSIDSKQPAVTTALARVDGAHPLTWPSAFALLNVNA